MSPCAVSSRMELNSVRWNSDPYTKWRSGDAVTPCAVSSKKHREPNSVKWDSYTK